MNINDLQYKYDRDSDILGVKVNRDFEYFETVELEEGLLLDLDKNHNPTSLEIHDASIRFNLSKDYLHQLM